MDSQNKISFNAVMTAAAVLLCVIAGVLFHVLGFGVLNIVCSEIILIPSLILLMGVSIGSERGFDAHKDGYIAYCHSGVDRECAHGCIQCRTGPVFHHRRGAPCIIPAGMFIPVYQVEPVMFPVMKSIRFFLIAALCCLSLPAFSAKDRLVEKIRKDTGLDHVGRRGQFFRLRPKR